MLRATDFFDLTGVDLGRPLEDYDAVWQILVDLPEIVDGLLGGRRVIKGTVAPTAVVEDGPVYIADGAKVEPGVYIKGPAYIGPSVTIRQGAYVRESCVFLEHAVLGHASEAKHSLFLPGAKAPHFAYVGDSVLGRRVNLGAGVKLSNVPINSRKVDGQRPTVVFQVDGRRVDTGLRKFGAILGDDVEIGCNAVLNPGVLLGPRSLVYPNATLNKGPHPGDTIYKLRQVIETDDLR